MFQHRVLEEQLLVHELAGGNSWLRIIPARGGMVTEWVHQGVPVLYMDHTTLHDPTKNVRGGIPILFPICGPLTGGKYNWEEKNYQLPQHGLARNLPWEVTQVTTRAAEALITLETESNEATLAEYPFKFHLSFTYQFRGDSLLIKQSYQHLPGKHTGRMPFYAGFHPYFWAPVRQAVTLEIPARSYQDLRTGQQGPYPAKLQFTGVAEANYTCTDLSESRVGMRNFGTNQQLILDFAEDFQVIVLWALDGRDFLCVEPWMAENDALNTRAALKSLAPGEQLNTWINIAAIPAEAMTK